MWLEAIITEKDLANLLEKLLPVKINLDYEGEKVEDDRWLLLHPATKVKLIPDQGLQVTCPAELSWSIAGVSPTMRIDELRVVLRPRVLEKQEGHVLEFGIEVEEAAFHSLPAFIDSTIVKAVNASLSTQKLSWNFTETLTRTVGLGKMFDPVEALQIDVSGGKYRITAEGLYLLVSFELSFLRAPAPEPAGPHVA